MGFTPRVESSPTIRFATVTGATSMWRCRPGSLSTGHPRCSARRVSSAYVSPKARYAVGRWSQPHRIYVLEGYELDEPTVKHEMLHDLLSYIGDYTHDDSLAFRVCDLTDEGTS